MSKSGLFIGNGDIENFDIIAGKLKASYDYVIALDGGVRHCKDLKLDISLLIGDLDSINNEELKGITIIKKKNQDLTDFQFALEYCTRQLNVKRIDAIGMTSCSRVDHVLFNIYQSIFWLKKDLEIRLLTENNTIITLNAGKHRILSKKGQTVSLVILTKTFVNITENLHWNLNNLEVSEPWFGISNIVENDTFYIDIEYGSVMIIMVDSV